MNPEIKEIWQTLRALWSSSESGIEHGKDGTWGHNRTTCRTLQTLFQQVCAAAKLDLDDADFKLFPNGLDGSGPFRCNHDALSHAALELRELNS